MDHDSYPRAVVADAHGQVLDHPTLALLGWDGEAWRRPTAAELIALPRGSDLFTMPGRTPYGVDVARDRPVDIRAADGGDLHAVAAFVAPAYLRLLHPAYDTRDGAPELPLYAYTAVGWQDGRFVVPAVRVDRDQRQDPYRFDLAAIEAGVRDLRTAHPANRAIAHVEHCALVYHCRAAQNFFLGRWEAPMPAASKCNAACIGCISDQTGSSFAANHERIRVPSNAADLIELACLHLQRVPDGVVSFGQGCEGEPLLQAKVLEDTVRGIRARTSAGVINLNSNASLPRVVARLADAGLDSVRISLNSARPEVYRAYYLPRGYDFHHVVQSLDAMKARGKYVSLNYFCFPGVTDTAAELDALCTLVARGVDLIQLRNLNIDPELYLRRLPESAAGAPLGMIEIVAALRRRFPRLRFGYFNPSRGKFGRPGTLGTRPPFATAGRPAVAPRQEPGGGGRDLPCAIGPAPL